jgi:hypothetical protein
MPAVSKAQNAAMHAAAEGHSTLGIPKSVGKEFVNATGSTKGLPEHKAKADSATDCSTHVHNYLGAVVKGDAAGMAAHAKKFHRGG